MLIFLRRWWYRYLVVMAITVVFLTMYLIRNNETVKETMKEIVTHHPFDPAPYNWRGLSGEQMKNLSVLGRRLFLDDESVPPRTDRNFTILLWKHGPHIDKRFLYLYGTEWHDPFANCSVSNCRLTHNSSELPIADALLIHLHRTQGNSSLPPYHGNPTQRWAFLTDENPYGTFIFGGNSWRYYNGFFNWSMTYRMDSDVPVPYGRTLPLTEKDIVPKRRPKTKLAAVLASHCAGRNGRWEYMKELRKHLEVDFYGGCGELKCAGHYGKDCEKLNDYKFYFAFENGDCSEYATEKVWWNAYNKDSIPVIMGVSLEESKRLFPPNSYLNIRNFSSPAHLAKYIRHLDKDPNEYESFFTWKNQYKVVNEHGYFQSPVFHYCRLCEALNYNDPAPKVYNNLEDFWYGPRDCVPPIKW